MRVISMFCIKYRINFGKNDLRYSVLIRVFLIRVASRRQLIIVIIINRCEFTQDYELTLIIREI